MNHLYYIDYKEHKPSDKPEPKIEEVVLITRLEIRSTYYNDYGKDLNITSINQDNYKEVKKILGI